MTLGQSVDWFGLHIYPMRILALAALMRVLIRAEWSFSSFNGIDKLLLLTFSYRTAIYILSENGSAITAIGLIVDVFLSYFSCRGLLRSFDDLVWFLRALVMLLIPYVGILYIESSTGRNPFAIIGGIVDHDFRHGLPRCLGSFSHSTILGTFGASFLPLFIALWQIKRSWFWGLLGTLLCLAIVFFSNSGGPLTCAMLAVLGWFFWFLRTRMLVVRLLIVVILILLGSMMKAPLWYLPAKISEITGGDGWHRSYLMDVAFQHFNQWWLSGMSVLETREWFPYFIVATGGADIINYYLDFGIAAGIGATALFCFLLIRSFSQLGLSLNQVRSNNAICEEPEILLWALGIVLSIHVFNWLGLVYFDQYFTIFLLQLAALSTLSHLHFDGRPVTVQREYLKKIPKQDINQRSSFLG